MFDCKDPEASVASQDITYRRMVDHVRNRSHPNQIEDNYELKRVEGCLKNLSVHQTSWAELGLSQAGTVSLELKLCSIGLASWG